MFEGVFFIMLEKCFSKEQLSKETFFHGDSCQRESCPISFRLWEACSYCFYLSNTNSHLSWIFLRLVLIKWPLHKNKIIPQLLKWLFWIFVWSLELTIRVISFLVNVFSEIPCITLYSWIPKICRMGFQLRKMANTLYKF